MLFERKSPPGSVRLLYRFGCRRSRRPDLVDVTPGCRKHEALTVVVVYAGESNFRSTSRENVHGSYGQHVDFARCQRGSVYRWLERTQQRCRHPEQQRQQRGKQPRQTLPYAFASGSANGTPAVTPQFSVPRAFTSSSVAALAAPVARPATVMRPE